MKKFLFSFSFIAMIVVAFSSCGETERHSLQLIHSTSLDSIPAEGGRDSITFLTTDNTTITPDESWCSVYGGNTIKVTHDYRVIYQLGKLLDFEPNPSTQPRVCTVKVQAYEYTVYGYYVQKGRAE